MKILGLNLFHPDSSAIVIVDNEIICAAEEERFTKIKHFSGFPLHSIIKQNFYMKIFKYKIILFMEHLKLE